MSKNKLSKQKSVEETYLKKTPLEHVLLRPDTYVGSIEKQSQTMWVWDSQENKIVHRQINFIPGLYKIFDEIIVNAADNKQRDPTMNRIDVEINPTANFIRVGNNGKGIPIVVHQEHKIYVPELIFGNLLTGTNFNDDEEKTTGGRNGYGAKLANIFSTKFIVEVNDHAQELKYKQEFSDNMRKIHPPKITANKGNDYVCVTFYPDLARFKMTSLDEDIVSLMTKRVYDIAASCCFLSGNKLNVYLNNQKIVLKNFSDYLALYEGLPAPIAFERVNEHWEVGIGVSDSGSFQQISFVNSICTSKGGSHVNYIADQVTARLVGVVKRRNKGSEVKPNHIKNHLAVFVNALIVNPAFDSQTKETLTTKAASFGSTCVLSEKMCKLIEKSAIVENVLQWSKFKQSAELQRKSGNKRNKVLGITKLDDANYAGSNKSSLCTLILTEGDSAKALAISGLGVVGRDYYGVFPLKGKLLNVREASHKQIMNNEEIQNIAKILGLTFSKVYEDVSSLRYGHVMIMTDQDHDGSHIKGLLINFFHHFWPSLLKIDGFLQQFITPIVKCTRSAGGNNNSQQISFYTIPEYKQWREVNEEGRGWKIKYYKGLGTSTAAEAKEYFSDLATHQLNFQWDENASDVIDMAFAKKRVEDRKLWLYAMEPGVHIDYKVEHITYDNFVNRELILFSHADNERSIAHFMDGLKPSQRKVLFACFKRNLKQEIKVAQLAGYVSEHSAYHHGEQSLTQTIIGMAQNFVGSNNINLLSPCGQFGTRLMGGKDAASPRYVFTKLEAITRYIFHPDDDALLEYLEDDGQSIEPEYYVPIIPMVLVNGSEGIGTGWSSSIPTYNPREIIVNIKRMIRDEEPIDMKPWFRGFVGEVQEKPGTTNFTVTGNVEVVDEKTVIISELPIGKWTTDYKQFLETVLVGNTAHNHHPTTNTDDGDNNGSSHTMIPFVKDFKENHTDTTVLFTVNCVPERLSEFNKDKLSLVKKFKLDTSVSTTNMHLFDLASHIRKHDGPIHILKEFFNIRMQYYDRRKSMLIKRLTEEWERLDNKMRFVQCVIDNSISVTNRKKQELLNEIKSKGFKAFDDRKSTSGEDVQDETETDSTKVSLERGYDYLLSMRLWSLTAEKVKELADQRAAKRQELDSLSAKSAETLWFEDLAALEQALDEFEAVMEESQRSELETQKKARRAAGSTKVSRKKTSSTSQKVKRTPTKRARKSSDDEDSLSDDSSEDDDFTDEDSDYPASPAKPKPRAKAPTPSPAAATKKSLATSAASALALSASEAKSASRASSSSTGKSTAAAVNTAATNVAAATGQQKSLLSFWGSSSSATAAPVVTSTSAISEQIDPAPAAQLIDITDSPVPNKSKPTTSARKSTAKTTVASTAKSASNPTPAKAMTTSTKKTPAKRARTTKSKDIEDEDIEDSESSNEIDDDDDSDFEEEGKSTSRKRTYSARKSSASSKTSTTPAVATPKAAPKSKAKASTSKNTGRKKSKAESDSEKEEAVDLVDSEPESIHDDDSDYEEEVKPKSRRRSSVSTSAVKKSAAKSVAAVELMEIDDDPLPLSLPPLPTSNSALKTPSASSSRIVEDTPPSLMERLKARRLSNTPIIPNPAI